MKLNSLSVGYNKCGQDFFDLLKIYRPFIYSYFFHPFHGENFEDRYPENFLKNLQDLNTYNIQANILFNFLREDNYETIYKIVSKLLENQKINLTQITLCSLETAEKIKKNFPQLETHLTVHYSNIYDFKNLVGIFDVVNLSGIYDFNNFEKIQELKSLDIKVKYILNKGCIINRQSNYLDFVDREKIDCDFCHQACLSLSKRFPWLKLARCIYFKEMIDKYFQMIDIWKLPTREVPLSSLQKDLHYYCIEKKTSFLEDLQLSDLSYPIFLEWLDSKVNNCKGFCKDCNICKNFYERLINADKS